MTLYFEDLSVGDTWEFGSYTVTEAEMLKFAEQYDPQPFHVDAEAAAETVWGELIASGLLTLCVATRLAVNHFLTDVATMGGLGMDNLRWYQPVHAGDTLSVRIEVISTQPHEDKNDRGYVDSGRAVYDQDGQEVMSVTVHNLIETRDE